MGCRLRSCRRRRTSPSAKVWCAAGAAQPLDHKFASGWASGTVRLNTQYRSAPLNQTAGADSASFTVIEIVPEGCEIVVRLVDGDNLHAEVQIRFQFFAVFGNGGNHDASCLFFVRHLLDPLNNSGMERIRDRRNEDADHRRLVRLQLPSDGVRAILVFELIISWIFYISNRFLSILRSSPGMPSPHGSVPRRRFPVRLVKGSPMGYNDFSRKNHAA